MDSCAIVQVLNQPAAVVQVEGPTQATVLATDLAIAVVTVAEQGPPGPPGLDSSGAGAGNSFAIVAGAVVSEYQVAVSIGGLAYTASASNLGHFGCVAGLFAQTSSSGAAAAVQYSGEIANAGWSFAPGVVFVGAAGQVTQTPPSVGFLQVVGTVMNPTTILIDVHEPILFTS